ncbi:MAG TPA: response regulator [Ignavibacteria bacterium]|nr:response regulator [Ignavibacteria bacterium]
MNIFLVEDSIYIRDRMKKLLRQIPDAEIKGFFDDSKTAFEEVQKSQPDIIIIDIFLKVGSGLDLITKVKSIYPDIIVIVFTNYAIPFFEKKCKDAGVNYFLDKSEDFDKVFDIVNEFQKV